MDRPRRSLHVALGIYVVVMIVFLATTAADRFHTHTPFNHFALLAESWLHGRLDLGGPPPPYTGNNDFAYYDGRYFISFHPFPALLIAPAVKLAGSAARVRDGLFFLWFAGVGPSALFLSLEKLSRLGRNRRSLTENAALALIFAFGTVYWFASVQGTVWFAAHLVGAGLCALYIYCSIGAAHPILAGLFLSLGFATRTPLGFAFPFFVYEAYRASTYDDPEPGAPALRIGRADAGALIRRLALFAIPAAAVLGLLLWHNKARFGAPAEFGHRYLAIAWRERIDRWGLFSYHYLGRNLSIVLTSLPYVNRVAGAPFQINAHGLALWVTSPFLLWAIWPKKTSGLFWAAALTALCVAAPSLLYQNSGWIQFGYRFSNDFAPFLIVLLAVGGRRLSAPFWVAGALAVVVNAFGALSFQRTGYENYYYLERTQRVIHQPD